MPSFTLNVNNNTLIVEAEAEMPLLCVLQIPGRLFFRNEGHPGYMKAKTARYCAIFKPALFFISVNRQTARLKEKPEVRRYFEKIEINNFFICFKGEI